MSGALPTAPRTTAPLAHGPDHPLLSHSQPVGIMTGENPLYPVQSPGGNEGLKRDLKALKAPFEEVWGKYGGVPERSLLIYGLPREHLYALGQKYGQESVIHSEGGQHQFIYTNGPKTGQMHVGNTHEHWPPGTPPPEDFYTDVPGVGALRLGFDFDNLHSAVPPAPAPAAPAPPISKHEVGHALHRMLTTVLKKADASGFSHVGSGAALNPSRELHNEAADYARKAGLPPPGLPPHTVDEGFLQRAAQTYEGLQHTPNDPEVKRAYDALKRETLAQYHHLLGKGYRFSAASGNVTPASFDPNGPQSFAYSGDEVAPPYAGDYNNLYDDITKNKHLHVFTGSPPPPDHPLAEAVPGGGPLPTYNDVFRAVHDVFGHAKAGSDFGHHGEDHTYHSHASMYSPLARRALATETRGQNSAFHYGANGAHNRANPAQAIYPDQKAALMPDEFVHPTPTSNPNLTGVSVQKAEGSTAVADHEKKALSVNDALRELHKLTKAQVESYEQQCMALRKAETAALEKKSPPGRKEEVEKLKAKGLPASEAFGIAWKQHNELDKMVADPESQKSHAANPKLDKAGVTDGGMGGMSSAPAPNLGEMAMAEQAAKKNLGNPAAYGPGGSSMPGGGGSTGQPPMMMAEDAQLEAYAKGEYKPGLKKDEDEEPEEAPECPHCGGEGRELGSLGKRKHFRCRDCGGDFSHEGMGKAELCKGCGYAHAPGEHDEDKMAERYAKGEYQPAGAQPDGPQPEKGVLPGDKAPKKVKDLDEGSGGQIEKGKLKKAGLAPAAGAPKAPAAPAGGAPKMAGLPKAPKLPGPAKPGAMAKPAAPAGGMKAPAMGAGQPNMKAEKGSQSTYDKLAPVAGRALDDEEDREATKRHLVEHHGLHHEAAHRVVHAHESLALDDHNDRTRFARAIDRAKGKMKKAELAKAGPPPLPGAKGNPNKEVAGLLGELKPKAPAPSLPNAARFDVSDEGPMKPGPAGPAPSKVALGPKDPALAGGLAKLPGVKGPAGRPGAAAQPGIASTRPAEQLPQKMGAPVVGKTIAMQSLAAPPAAGRAAPPAIPGAAAAPAPAKKPGIFGRLGAMMGKAEDKPVKCGKCGEDHKGVDHATAVLMGPEPKVLHPSDKKKAKK